MMLVQRQYSYESEESKLLFDMYENVFIPRLSLEDAVVLSQGNHENARMLDLEDIDTNSDGIKYLISNDEQFDLFTAKKLPQHLKQSGSFSRTLSLLRRYPFINMRKQFLSLYHLNFTE